MEIIVNGNKATVEGKELNVNLKGKEYWEKHSILLDYIKDNGLNACIVPYDCEGGCQIISCRRNIGTMGV